jgi:D-alanyl-lipoteichoic acid acyltransferase DltB (MBOAT superfamily)
VLRLAAATDERRRRQWLIFSVTVNLAILGVFKYFNFFVGSAADMARTLGVNWSEPALQLILPVGISFYVFHEISYAVDVYRRRVEPETDLIVYALYVAFFPQLVAGPITRAAHMLPQFRRDRRFPNSQDTYSACVLIVSGLFKKVVLADTVAPYVNQSFAHPGNRGFIPLTFAMVAFSIQIYGDFAGYTDIARGVARLFGIDIARNFEQPYLSRNITEFWRRWHISLSSFLHDYLYVPLGGNRISTSRTYVNLMLVMLLGGLWHGASWTFVIWGGLHGLALVLDRAFGRTSERDTERALTMRQIPAIVGTFGLVSVLWVFFRASSLSNAIDFFRGMASGLTSSVPGAFNPDDVLIIVAAFTIMVAMDLVDRHRETSKPLVRLTPFAQGTIAAAAFVLLLVFSGAAPAPFIYFQF